MIVLWQTRGCETHPKKRGGIGAGIGTEKGRVRKGAIQREADRERGTQGSFHRLAWRTGGALIAAVRLGQKPAGTRRESGESPCFHMCANVLFGTLPEALLI